MAAEDAGQQVHGAGQHEEPRRQKVQAPPPAVLIEDVVGPARADGARGVLEEGSGFLPSAVLVVPADGQLEERRRQVVPRLAPVEPGMSHQDPNPLKASVRKLTVTIQ